MKRTSYQNGSVLRKERKLGPDVWVYRYKDSDGSRKSETIGSVDKFPTKAAAIKRAAKLRDEINNRVECVLVSGLCDKYKLEHLPDRVSTSSGYRSYLKRFREEWGPMRLDTMAKDIMAIESWVNGYQTLPTAKKPARPASKKTKVHMKWFVHLLFEKAIKWGMLSLQRNPILLVEVKGKNIRVRKMNLLTSTQWVALIEDPDLSPHVRTMIFIAMLLGLRASEILGLRWEDIDVDEEGKPVIRIRRSHVGKDVDDTKTEESEQELPIHEDLGLVLEAWRESSVPVNGWMFGNIVTGRPFWRDSLQVDHLIPAGKKVGIPNLGWHDFRHTYRAMMRKLNISLEEQRTLMRHEDIRTTLGYGGKTPAEVGRPANAKVVEMLRKRA